MSVSLALLLQAVPVPPPTPPEGEDVVVMARKLQHWRATISTDPFGTRCKTKQSTGDGEIDAIGCAAMTQCWPDTLARLRAAHARGVAKPDRARLEQEASDAFGACSKPKRAAMIDALAARRAAARESGS